ncbi:circadian clock protein KaiC [Flavisolibacter ginsenosidimutans]|uniref:non-specific serine/threonine protein kinase n=1 Tax=Flavisolibacter ginsenosidimutans TaxID=661481 RepID=A0A5B8UKX1_9BACT|nr:circadian clock protein KaiC [Flavisolibacter ginsenosidimutans]QEC57213.1 circadian clock protein KaiC [Flavisolibacter ginsenosidimutans]
MPLKTKATSVGRKPLPKTPTGIRGLDEITGGGLPTGRPTLICGAAGCGKTLFAAEFIVRGATEHGEPGVFIAFEEKAEELAINVASLGFDLAKLQKDGLVRIDHVYIDKSEIEETGEYDLDGLFIRLGYAIDSIGAKRVVLDTIENLFSGLSNQAILRAELRRLFGWLKDKGVTAVITGEKGEGTLTRQGLEEYVSDCVILLDHRVANQISTRLLRIVKYRGSVHGTNEYPFLIDEDGISVLPITSLMLNANVSSQRISSGIPALDKMLGGKGFFRGSSILVSGTAGTGKTSIAAVFANESCRRKERCLYFAFEESPQQIVRNMLSIGIDLKQHIDKGLLEMHAARPTLNGLEMHLVAIHKHIKRFKPRAVILDPITNLVTIGSISEVKSMLIRLIDFLQTEQITVMFTALSLNTVVNEQTDEGVSSLVDAWLLVRDLESNGERNRGLYIMKSRGMKHSNQVREFVINDSGVSLVDVYLGPDGVLTGSAREAQQLSEATGEVLRSHAINRKDIEIQRKRKVLEAKIASLQEEFESVQDELNKSYIEENIRKEIQEKNRRQLIQNRHSKNTGNGKSK